MKFSLFNAMIDQKYGVTVYGFDSHEEKTAMSTDMHNWCTEQFGVSKATLSTRPVWKQSFMTFYFMKEKQRAWFLLKWS